jgi:hypothetical protein
MPPSPSGTRNSTSSNTGGERESPEPEPVSSPESQPLVPEHHQPHSPARPEDIL